MSLLRVARFPGRGRGVVARADIRAGDLIESCPMLPIEDGHDEAFQESFLSGYVFEWDDHPFGFPYALALGMTSLCNHSAMANAEVEIFGGDDPWLQLTAVTDIAEGEEVTIYYCDELWFTPEGSDAITADSSKDAVVDEFSFVDEMDPAGESPPVFVYADEEPFLPVAPVADGFDAGDILIEVPVEPEPSPTRSAP